MVAFDGSEFEGKDVDGNRDTWVGGGRGWTGKKKKKDSRYINCYRLLHENHYRIQPLCRVPVTLGKGQFALGKLFAECNTRQTPLGKASHDTVVFAECRISGTRQRLCQEPWHSALEPRGAILGGIFAECLTAGTRQNGRPGSRHVVALPSAGSWQNSC